MNGRLQKHFLLNWMPNFILILIRARHRKTRSANASIPLKMMDLRGAGTRERERVFVNPPYGKEISKWVKKAYEESRYCEVVVMLIPARTDTAWFWNYIHGKAEIRFVRGRLHFNDSKSAAPFPSMVAVFNNSESNERNMDANYGV